MAPRKKPAPKVEHAVSPGAPSLPTPIPSIDLNPKNGDVVKVISVIADLRNPDQGKWIPADVPVEIEMDNWLRCQIKAGLILQVAE